MKEAMNKPYVKMYDENGAIINPIKGKLITRFEARKQRREYLQKERFVKNTKAYHLFIMEFSPTSILKYRRFLQLEKDKDGKRKTIKHYLLN